MLTLIPALTDDDVTSILSLLPSTLSGIRTAAMIAIAFDGAMRMRELVALNIEDFHAEGDDLIVTGQRVSRLHDIRLRATGVLTRCPVLLFYRWATLAAIASGPAFVPVVGRRARRGVRLHEDVAKGHFRKAAETAGILTVAGEVIPV